MLMLDALNALLNKNAGLTTLVIVLMFGIGSYNSFQTNVGLNELSRKVENQTYDYSFRLVASGFSEAKNGAEALEKTRFWIENRWDAQLTALDILCDQPRRENLYTLVPSTTAVDICRIVR